MLRHTWLQRAVALAFGLLLAALAPATAFAGPETEEKFTVLSFHEIADPSTALIPGYAVTPTMFVRQIDWLRNNGYNFVSVDDIVADRENKRPLPEKAVLITFDDGYQSMYEHAWPLLKMLKIPSVVAVVGAWEDDKGTVNFDGRQITRDKLMSWAELKELSDSGLVEIGSHTYDLHHGIQGNPQGNMQPAAATRQYSPATKSYEKEPAYRERVAADLKKSRDTIQARIGRAPRVIAWPYGRYSYALRDMANQLGMTIGLTLDDGGNMEDTPLSAMRRVLVESGMDLAGLADEMNLRNQNLSDNDRAQKVMHVDLDYIYDADPAQQERNLGHMLDRIQSLNITTVYLQAFADPDADGSADAVYFPSRHMPMRSDLFNRVAWQIETRTQVRRVYAWMPLMAWELPASEPASADKLVTLPSKDSDHVNMGYNRLSMFSPRVRQTIKDIYQDLARSALFDGVLFHDDATLSDYEDASSFALATYKKWGLPDSIEKIRASDDLVGRWTVFKINAIDQFAGELADTVRKESPALKTARNLYARVVLNPKAEVWYSQALENSLANYDFTAIMAMPYMEGATDAAQFYRDLVARVKSRAGAMSRVVFEIQTVDWAHDEKPIPVEELTATIKSLYDQGVEHVAYYPDMLFENHPDWSPMRHTFALKPNLPRIEAMMAAPLQHFWQGALSFAFYYPLFMSWLWMLGAAIFWQRNERKGPPFDKPVERVGSPGVSVLIPCYNEGDNAEETLTHALGLDYPDFEVIAINDGSRDNTGAVLDRLAAKYPKLRVVHLAQNQGKAMALQAGALLASNEILIGIDGDALIDKHCAHWLVRHFMDDAHVGAVTGNPRIRNRTTLLGRLQVGEFSSIVGLIKRAQKAFGALFTVSGVITAFRRSAVHDVGYWSADMLTEDIDITWKLQRAGWRVKFEPNALVWILMPETLRGLWKQRLRWARGGAQVLLKNIDVFVQPSQRSLWPLMLELCASVVWAFNLVLLLAAGLLSLLLPKAGLPATALMFIPQSGGLILAATCLAQFAFSMWLDSRYDRGLGRYYYWIIWYPLAYWLISTAATLVAYPTVIFRRGGKRARWISPDRGIRPS